MSSIGILSGLKSNLSFGFHFFHHSKRFILSAQHWRSMASSPRKTRPVGRKFVISCDGTWMNSDMGYDQSQFAPPTAQIPTNITRMVRALKHKDAAGVPQIVFYQRGAGSDGGFEDKYINGITGGDVSELVREAYAMLANNFDPETQADLNDESKPRDEIVLLGFSRGAFTARAISSLISDIGLLTRIGMENFWGIFGDWMRQDTEGSKWFESTYGKKIPFSDPKYRQTLIDNGLTRWGMPIRAVGVFDTVGSLGIPLPWKSANVKEYSFVNTQVAQQVEHAFHAVALDEHRNLFTPTLWEIPDEPNKLQVLKQVWFPGVHSNIGGSYADAGISNITLAWMVSQFEDTDGSILTFDPDYLNWVQDMNNKYYPKVPEPVRPWGLGKIYDSAPLTTPSGRAQALNPIVRTPGRYHKVSTENGKQGMQRLRYTNESIHRSVRVRMDDGGLGTEEEPDTSEITKILSTVKKAIGLHTGVEGGVLKYKSAALSNYELVQSKSVEIEDDHSREGDSGVVWRAKDGLDSLPEAELGRTEIRLLRRSVETSHDRV